MPTIDDYATPLKMPMTIYGFSRFPALAGYKAELKGATRGAKPRKASRSARST